MSKVAVKSSGTKTETVNLIVTYQHCEIFTVSIQWIVWKTQWIERQKVNTNKRNTEDTEATKTNNRIQRKHRATYFTWNYVVLYIWKQLVGYNEIAYSKSNLWWCIYVLFFIILRQSHLKIY